MSRSRPDWRPERIVVGRVGRPHGLDGSVHLTGFGGVVPLTVGTRVRIGERDALIAGRKGTAERPVLRFDVAPTRDAALALQGQEVSVAAETLPETPEGEFFQIDLIGCEVAAGGHRLGMVERVQEYPANDVLVLDGGEMIPFVEDVVLDVDVPGRRITVRDDFP
ncbi:MAG: ribosome maturation factor RimM [Gaiellales bacterium]